MTDDQGNEIFIFTVGDATMKVTNDLSSLSAAREARITIGGQLYTDEETMSPDGEKLLMQEHFGAAFFTGLQEIDLELDNGIVSGSINGQQLVPEPVGSQTVELASGAPLPTWSGTPSADAQALAVYDAASACLDPPPIGPPCLNGDPRCVPRIPPPDGGTDSGSQPQSGHPGGGGACPLIKDYDVLDCKTQEEMCLANPPQCAGDLPPKQCLQAIIENRKLCMQTYKFCVASVGTITIGGPCDPNICGACCDGTACELGALTCCVPFGSPSLQCSVSFAWPTVGLPTCIVGEDDTCCPDGIQGSYRSCVQSSAYSPPTCCGNNGSCCAPGGNDCCAGQECLGGQPQDGAQETSNSSCSATCCAPLDAPCGAQTHCCPITVGSAQQQMTCDYSGHCTVPPQGLCDSSVQCADNVPCTCPGGAPYCAPGTATCCSLDGGGCFTGNDCCSGSACVDGACCAPNGTACAHDSDCCSNQGAQICDTTGLAAGRGGQCAIEPGGSCTPGAACAYGLPCENDTCCAPAYTSPPGAFCCYGLRWDGATCLPPDHTLEVWQNGNVLWADSIDPPYQMAFGPADTTTDFGTVAATSLGGPTVTANFTPSSFQSFANQGEAYLFARDPEERYQTMRTIVNDNDGWQAQVAMTPDAFVLVSPDAAGNVTNSAPVTISSFGFGSLSGPAAGPSGQGSIKEIRALSQGACTMSISMDTIGQRFTDEFLDQINAGVSATGTDTGALCTTGLPILPMVPYTNFTTYLRHPPNYVDDGGSGGFLFNSDITVSYVGTGVDIFSCQVAFTWDFNWVLFPSGSVALEPVYEGPGQWEGLAQFDEIKSGAVCDGVPSSGHSFTPWLDGYIQNAAQNLIPAEFSDLFDRAQSFPPYVPEEPDVCNAVDCACQYPTSTVGWGSDWAGCNPSDNTTCADAVSGFLVNMKLGVGASGVNFSPDQLQALVDTVTAKDGAGQYVNWRCASWQNRSLPASNACSGGQTIDCNGEQSSAKQCSQVYTRCEYLLPAKRLNVTSNALDLVFFDQTSETGNPSLPFYFVLQDADAAAKATGNTTSITPQFCSRKPVSSSPSFTETMPTFTAPYTDINTLGYDGCPQ